MSIRRLEDLEKDGWKVSAADKYLKIFYRFQADLKGIFQKLEELLTSSSNANKQTRDATESLQRTMKSFDEKVASNSMLVDKATSALVRMQKPQFTLKPVIKMPEPVDDTGAQWECLVMRDRTGRISRVLITKVKEE